ncbi:MAG: hypothetical protein ACKV2T_27725 [Kofleriaceae bacterium]
MLESDPPFRAHQLGALERVVISEGEYGAWIRIDGVRDGARSARFIGAVFAEDFAAMLECVAMRLRHFDELAVRSRALLREVRLQLRERPRRFYYAAPVGWQALLSGVTANWYPPDFPNNLTTIAGLPAERVTSTSRALHDESERLVIESSSRDELTNASPTTQSGTLLPLHGKRIGRAEPIFRELAVFFVDDVAYRMRLETTAAAARAMSLVSTKTIAGSETSSLSRVATADIASSVGMRRVRRSSFV